MMYCYIIGVKVNFGYQPLEIDLDTFHAIKDWPEHLGTVGFKVARRIDPTFFNKHADVLSGMHVRTRFNPGSSLHALMIPLELDREDLLQFLETLPETRLKELMNSSELHL